MNMSLPHNYSSDASKIEPMDFGIYYMDLIQCPLNPNHKLRRHRLPYHILKCKKHFPDKVQCPYGHYYYSNKEEMAHHLQICSHKPRMPQAEEMQPHVIEVQYSRKANINHNYDVNNYEIDEPFWN